MKRALLFVRDSPEFVYWVNLGILLFLLPWTLLLAVPGSPLFKLGGKVWYVTLISHIALILAAWSTLQAARVQIEQRDIERRRRQEEKAKG